MNRRRVGAELEVTIEVPSQLALQVAVACGGHDEPHPPAEEHLQIELDGRAIPYTEIAGPHGGRMHVVNAQAGVLTASYSAIVDGASAPAVGDRVQRLADELEYLRPSRYCESDRLAAFATGEFGHPSGSLVLHPGGATGLDRDAATERVAAVTAYVRRRLEYVAGSSTGTDGAVETLLSGRGVCRDFAHLTVALLRAIEVPARVVAVYAPGLDPMDFHAVVEVAVGGHFFVVDPTRLAPRHSLVRVSTGRDAADTAWLSTYGGTTELRSVTVTAIVDGDLPIDDHKGLIALD